MNTFERSQEENKQEKEINKENELETKEISIEQLAEIVYRNGSMLESELNSHFLERKRIMETADHHPKEAQSVYLFNNELYLLNFDVSVNDSESETSGYSLSPKKVSKLKMPTEKK